MAESNIDAVKYLLTVVEVGAVVSVFLFGIFTVQLYIYYSRFPDDRWQLKTLVATVSVLELAHVISALHYFYTVSISWYNRPDKIFAKAPIGIDIETLLGGYIACLVQIFFTIRARRLTGARYTTAFCFFLSFARFVLTTIVVVFLIKKSLAEFEQNWGWLVTVTLVDGAAVDIIVAILLSAHLIKERRTSFQRTTRMIDRIILMTLQTGLITSLLTIAVMVFFVTMTKNYVWVALYMCLARVFSNSLLATLNARTVLRRMADNVSLRLAESSPGHIRFAHPKTKAAIPIGMNDSVTSQSTFEQSPDEEHPRACSPRPNPHTEPELPV